MKQNKNRLSYQSQLSRHSHDVSAGYTASLTTGPIVPQYFHILGPGDTIYCQPKMFARLQDVVTAFFGEVDVHLDAFFVPLQMMYTPFGQVFAQTNDYISNVFNPAQQGEKSSKFPLINLGSNCPWLPNWNNSTVRTGHLDCKGRETMRLFSALDINPYWVFSSVIRNNTSPDYSGSFLENSLTANPQISPWVFTAYQCIYQKYYRNDELEKLDVGAYNFDTQFNQVGIFEENVVTLRYHQRPSDYFTETRVSPMFSAVNNIANRPNGGFPSDGSSPSEEINKVLDYLGPSSAFYGNQSFLSANQDITASNSFVRVSETSRINPYSATYDYLNTANIRALFAIDKFARIYGRADKTYDAQVLAHFGIEIPHDVKHDLTHIKHYHIAIQSDPIYGTANTVNSDNNIVSSLGQVGGQANGTLNGEQLKFTAPVHGVFMIVAYALSKPRYYGTFSKLHLLSDRLSFPIPEFDKLGAQPLYAFEHSIKNLGSNFDVRSGWQNRYQQFKKKYNRISPNYQQTLYTLGDSKFNLFAPYVISRSPFDTTLGSSLKESSSFIPAFYFFELPTSLNTVMAVEYQYTWSDDYWNAPHLVMQSDPIITEFFADAKVVSWMSETGEPDL